MQKIATSPFLCLLSGFLRYTTTLSRKQTEPGRSGLMLLKKRDVCGNENPGKWCFVASIVKCAILSTRLA